MLRFARRMGPLLRRTGPHAGRSIRFAPAVESRRGAWQGAWHGEDTNTSQGDAWSNAECFTVAGIALAAVAGTTVAYNFANKALARFIKEMVETYDKSFIGVDITIGSLSIYPLHAKAQILDLVISNPPGFESPYMMKVGKMTLDLDWLTILNPYSTKIVVEKATFKHAAVNIEYHHMWEGKSNLDEIAARGHHPDKEPDPDWKAKKEAQAKKHALKKTKAKDRDWWVEELKLVDLEVRYARGFVKETIMLPDIVYDHFSKQVGSNYIDDIVIILLQFIVTNVVAHITSPSVAAALVKPKSQDEDDGRKQD